MRCFLKQRAGWVGGAAKRGEKDRHRVTPAPLPRSQNHSGTGKRGEETEGEGGVGGGVG